MLGFDFCLFYLGCFCFAGWAFVRLICVGGGKLFYGFVALRLDRFSYSEIFSLIMSNDFCLKHDEYKIYN